TLPSLSATALAVFCSRSRLSAITRFWCSTSRRLRVLASTARPRGKRKFRAKPGFTFTTSPMLPRFSTSSRRITCMTRSSAHRRERQQRDAARALDRGRQPTLVPRAVAGDPAGDDLPAIADEAPEHAGVLVVDADALLGAEPTHLAPAGAAPAARSAVVAPAPPSAPAAAAAPSHSS